MGDDGKVTDIYFLTQLTPDEKVAMVSPTQSRFATDIDIAQPIMDALLRAFLPHKQQSMCCYIHILQQ